jgi:hypothetical protein
MKEVLELVKEEYIKREILFKRIEKGQEDSDEPYHVGLCYCAMLLEDENKINEEEHDSFSDLIQRYGKTKVRRYDYYGNRGISFFWGRPTEDIRGTNKDPRVKWLNRHIKRYKN